ncbi:MAG: methionine synthase, partial [Actinobacteria bacterium]|nr:methionine synthase [Actinomycetota bacterium]
MVWDPGTATALGPFPGADPREAARIVRSELPLPFLPELPARGVGADPVGRTAGLLADLHVEVATGVWRFVPRGGRDEQRARTTLVTDLDALEEAAGGHNGPLKVRIVGPWSLAASIELPRGEKALADPGAVRDIAASLTEGLTRHLADVRRRLPALTRLVVQVDEPFLPAVLAGELATASGWGKLRSYERGVVEDGLRQVLTAAGDDGGVWLGSARFDGELLRGAGAGFLGLDGAVLDMVDEDEIGEAIDAGLG